MAATSPPDRHRAARIFRWHGWEAGVLLRLTRSEGVGVEFVLSRAGAFAWRSHLGLWAVRERQADTDQTVSSKR